ncbi:MAG: hypothetical protein SGILL_006418 [Bacillariaceae sp.]
MTDALSIAGVSTETGPNTGYSGGGYADFNGGAGSFLLWNVNAAYDGDYDIALRYSSPNTRPLDLYVDNVKQGSSFRINPTGTWNEWKEEVVNKIRLSPGSHEIKVVVSGVEGPNIDFLSIKGPLDGRSTILEPDQGLNLGEFRSSPRGLFEAGLDMSGQLIIQEASSSTTIWTSGKSGGNSVYMQRDGNLVVKDAGNSVVWSSATFGPGARFAIDDLGLGAILLGDDPLWTAVRSATALIKDQTMRRGEFKPSPSGDYKIGLETNGELVVKDEQSNTVTWRSGREGGDTCLMQNDGNLVVKNGNGSAIWSSTTDGYPGARLTIDDAGKAFIMHGTLELWNSADGKKQIQQQVIAVAPPPVFNPNTIQHKEAVVLESRQHLTRGRFMSSPSGNYKVGLNSAGDLLFQDRNDNMIWHAGIQGGADAYMQPDGNFAIRDSSRRLIWTTHTSENNGANLVIDDGGRLSVVHNGHPIWMEGLPRGQYTGPSSPDLHYPLRGVFYYPWYPETWSVNGKQAHFIPDLGAYSSDDPRVIDEHLDSLEYAYTDVAIASWWGPGTQKLARISHLMDETIEQNSQIKWTVYYEEEFTLNPSVDKLKSDLNYLRKWFAWHPTWAHIEGKPVIFVYNEAGCGVAERWRQAVAAADGDWYVVLKLFPGFKGCSNQPNSWHQYGPADEYIHIRGETVAVSPGFWRADREVPQLGRVSKARFCENVEKMVRSGEDWQLVTTFNECGEGTHVEASSPNWGSETKYGYYLDCLHRHH